MSKRTKWLLGIAAIAALVVGWQVVVLATSLPGSNFEIDTDANLKVDNAAPSIDWASVNETRKTDTASGQNDESFGQGTKEDTAVPSIVTGGIPPNKSDLKFFGVYQEGNTSTGFLNLFWSRVQDPSGTTNMDFELNKRQCTPGTNDADCTSNGVTPIRSVGDVLIIYDLSQGGVNPVLSIRRWTASGAWGPATDLTAASDATGSINSSPIPAGDSDGLGAQSARTFGEAQVKLSVILPAGTCASFGSAYLKSRSSDSFTAALKDFVPPVPVSVTNCGRVVVKKVDEGGQPLTGAEFTINPANSATPSDNTLNEVGTTGVHCIDNLLIGTQYTITETKAPPGYDPDPTSFTFTPSQSGSCSDVTGSTNPDKTFTNVAQKGAIQVTKTAKHADTSGNTSPNLAATFTVKKNGTSVGTITTDGTTGKGCLGDLPLGSYTVEETNGPNGYAKDTDTETAAVNSKGTCLSGFVNVSFENTPLTNLTVSVDSHVDGGTASTITCDNGGPNGSTGPNGDGSETASDLEPGTYTCKVVIDP